MIKEYTIQDKDFLKDRAYYEKIPKHVLLLPDGGRRFGHKKSLSDMEIYDLGQRICQDFVEVCLNEFNLDTASIFFLRPSSFDKQRRTEENIRAIEKYIADHPDHNVLQLGCALLTHGLFVPEGVKYLGLDLPGVIEARRKFYKL